METVSHRTTDDVWTREIRHRAKRDVWQAMKRGLRCRCPNCGEGKLFRAFLKTDDDCPACGQDFIASPRRRSAGLSGDRHRRPYPGADLACGSRPIIRPSVALQLAFYLPVTLVASLALLQPVKGAVVGLQWAFRMHGFDENEPDDPLTRG